MSKTIPHNTEDNIKRSLPRFSNEEVYISELDRTMTCLIEWSGTRGTVRIILWNGTYEDMDHAVDALNEMENR